MRERYISQDRAEQLIADIINRGGTTGEILTEIHHMEAADVLTLEETDAMAAMEPNFGYSRRKEYIEREAALKAIYTSTAPALEVKAMPAIEVVRCRECRHAASNGLDIKCNKHSGTKNKLGEEIDYIEWHTPYFFCADGKRKDGGQDE